MFPRGLSRWAGVAGAVSVGRNWAEPDSAVPLADLSSLWLRAIRFYFAFPSSELDKGLGRQCQVLGLHRRNLPASEGLGVRFPPACPHQPLLTPPRQPPARTPRVHSAPPSPTEPTPVGLFTNRSRGCRRRPRSAPRDAPVRGRFTEVYLVHVFCKLYADCVICHC